MGIMCFWPTVERSNREADHFKPFGVEDAN